MYLHFRLKKNYLQRCNFTLILSIENVDKEFRKCEGESIRWGFITDEHRKAITLSAMDKWEKNSRFKRTIKERRQFDNKKPEKLELELDNFDVDNLYPTSFFQRS